MRRVHPVHDLVDCLERRLAKRVDIRPRDVAEVNRASHAMRDVSGTAEPLVGLQQGAKSRSYSVT